MKTTYDLKTGMGKTGKPWFMVIFTTGKFVSEPLFISEIDYDYLSTAGGATSGTILDEE